LARRFFENWRASLKSQRLGPYERFAEMIDRHWDGIAAYCKPENKVSLGFVEGLNNKIRVFQRRAYGLRDEEYLRLTQNWRARPLTDRLAVVELIAATTTKTGLKVESALDTRSYKKGIKVSKAAMKCLNITGDQFHPEWNYTVNPWQPP
jgi:hypothetical protein